VQPSTCAPRGKWGFMRYSCINWQISPDRWTGYPVIIANSPRQASTLTRRRKPNVVDHATVYDARQLPISTVISSITSTRWPIEIAWRAITGIIRQLPVSVAGTDRHVVNLPCQLTINKYARTRNTRTQMYAGHVACCRLVSHVDYAPRALLRLEKRRDRRTDECQTITLRYTARCGQRKMPPWFPVFQ